MTKTVILDTNVLYDIGLNRVRVEDVRRPTLTPQHVRAAQAFSDAHNLQLAPGSTA